MRARRRANDGLASQERSYIFRRVEFEGQDERRRPAIFIVLPRFYGGPLSQLFNLTQHAGMNEDVYDHRLNTRTVILNPVFSFLYANMNYHIEHHMFPMVPFYRLPELHDLINADCPPAYSGLRAAYREIVPALLRQRKDPS
jgi:fatty acid desaturase